MTPDDLDRLAALIAAELQRAIGRARDGAWVPTPVRPDPPARTGELPAWSGAAQSLGDVVPLRHPTPSAHRADPSELTAAVRAAAAGRGVGPGVRERSPAPSGARSASSAVARRRRDAGVVEIPVGVSRRHLHLSAAHAHALFGDAPLEVHKPLRQPGQFAAVQEITAEGPKGRIERIRVVGPPRGETQLELAHSDAAVLGVEPPLAASGTLEGSVGGVTLVGPNGRVALERGVIIAARHLHLAPADGARWGLCDGDRLDVSCGEGGRAVTWHEVLVRCGPMHATELHLDVDEAQAAGVTSGATARIVGWHGPRSGRRPLVTERDLLDLVRRGARLPASAIYTPGARDRARALGVDLP